MKTSSPTTESRASDRFRSGRDRSAYPDIYLIVLDAQGRDDLLARHFGIEDGLGARLEELGFYVAEQSLANYGSTMEALPSLLNFDFNAEPHG